MTENAPVSPERKEKFEHFEFAARSFAKHGKTAENQDSYIADQDLGIAAVFDGVGGHNGGKEASQIAMGVVRDRIETWDDIADDEADSVIPESLKNVLHAADTAVIKLGKTIPGNPGTTASVVKLYEFQSGRKVAYIAHVGDSRIYIYRAQSNVLEKVTEDSDIFSRTDDRKSLGEYYERDLTDAEVERIRNAVDAAPSDMGLPEGIERYSFRMRNVLKSALGDVRHGAQIRSYQVDLNSGDILIGTSDGVHDNLDDTTLHKTIEASKESADMVASALAQTAHDFAQNHYPEEGWSQDDPRGRAKKDDITAVAVKVV